MFKMEQRCYYCHMKATKIIKWTKIKVYACNKCSEKTTGKVENIKSQSREDLK